MVPGINQLEEHGWLAVGMIDAHMLTPCPLVLHMDIDQSGEMKLQGMPTTMNPDHYGLVRCKLVSRFLKMDGKWLMATSDSA